MQQQNKPTIVHGYVIQIWRADQPWYKHEDSKAYAIKGQLPEEWEATKQDETIIEAQIYSTTQALKRAGKRIIADHFKREA